MPALYLLTGVICASTPFVDAVVDIEPVWAGHPVGFPFRTYGDRQYLAYYDAGRQMTVARRKLPASPWMRTKLDSHVGWDSHNHISIAEDDAGHLHLVGNLHGSPLIYYRTTTPHDTRSLVRVDQMVGPEREQQMTYPQFIDGPDNQLIFTYRDGGSGRGDQVYNVYDGESGEWRRLIDTAFVSGEDVMNAYFTGPITGPDGYFHLAWVWRDTPDAATNHDVSYARSRDLVHWEDSGGGRLRLPIIFGTADIADPAPARSGLLNGNLAIGFDAQNRVILTYHRHDARGDMQMFGARRESAGWRIYQISDWAGYRWNFGGHGALPSVEVYVSRVRLGEDGALTMRYHYGLGAGVWRLDPDTLQPIGDMPEQPDIVPPSVYEVESQFPGMRKQVDRSLGRSDESGIVYYATWETLPANRDRPREGALPGPSMLRVIRLADVPPGR